MGNCMMYLPIELAYHYKPIFFASQLLIHSPTRKGATHGLTALALARPSVTEYKSKKKP
jgi:hypothetical protein